MGLMSICIIIGFISFVPVQGLNATGTQDANQGTPDIQDAFSRMDEVIAKQDEEFTLEDEYYLGRAVAANILETYKPYRDNPKLTQYLNKICAALVLNASTASLFNGYHLMILDSSEFNAFATSGGHIFITRAFIEIANAEDALAAIIAHEIAHIHLKHGVGIIKGLRVTQDLLNTADQAATVAEQNAPDQNRNRLFIGSVREMVNTMVINGYSQSQEFEADEWALSFLALAGYNPSSLIDVLKLLETNQSGHPGGFNKTHPSPALRISQAQRVMGKYRVPDTRSYRVSRFKAK